ncbi:MAG: Cysteine--tRNA ligase [Thermotogales bacterium 46_20]|nr:MAG: Cysteine--tRNA ligase [Thermotogales bacterium 46_20]
MESSSLDSVNSTRHLLDNSDIIVDDEPYRQIPKMTCGVSEIQEENMEIFLTNTLTKKKERFKPLNPDRVGIYTCGLTVYNYAHIGNLRAYVFSDILKRMFLYNDYAVKHVMNITDVGHLTSDDDEGEDKLEAGARREGKSVWEIVDFYTDAFLKDMEALNIIRPDIVCRATEHIDDMIEMIRRIHSISCSGLPAISTRAMLCSGTLHGGEGFQVGTLNAPPCPQNTWENALIYILVVLTTFLYTTQMKLPRVKQLLAMTGSITGFTTNS